MMSEIAAWTDEVAGSPADKRSAVRPVIFLSVVILALGLGASTWLYFQETRAVARNTALGIGQELPAGWVFWVVAGTAGGGTVFLLAMIAGVTHWRRGWQHRIEVEDANRRSKVTALEFQLEESRREQESLRQSQEQAQKKSAGLEYTNAQLQSELNLLKRAEKSMAQQRQALESSKSVLELHVEARTKELAKLQRRYEHILNSAGEGICGLDVEGRTIFVNPVVEKLTGWSVLDLLGKTEGEIFGPESVNGHSDDKAANLGERIFHRSDGSCFPVEFVKTPINENGRVVGSVLVFKDITERKRSDDTLAQRAAELARSNAELEQFAFVASHDLQEPLRKIQAFGDRLKTKCEGAIAKDAHDYLERMQNAAARMRTLIDDLLTFSRVIRSSEPFVPVDLGVITREVLGDLEVRVEKCGGRVEVGELPTIEADSMQMRQLILNLLSNALKFQAPGAQPVVRISSRLMGTVVGEQLCEISVQDNGIGFEEKYLEKIFAVFQRLHGRNEYEGTGVGLAVCRRITDRHHGTITAHSQLGQGANFIITLPVKHSPSPPANK